MDATQRTMDILRERFEGMIISRGGGVDVNWPPRFKRLLDRFLLGRLKSHGTYANETADNRRVQSQRELTRATKPFEIRTSGPRADEQKPRRTFERRYVP